MKRLLNLFVLYTFVSINPSMLLAQNIAPYWSLSGNNNAAGTSILGTTNSIPLRLFTKNAERMRIDETGRVGIGINTPVNILTIKTSGGTPVNTWLNGVTSPVFVGFADAISSEFVLADASNAPSRRAVFQGRRARGTLASPLAVANNDYLTSLLASGYDGTTFQNPATIDIFVDGTPSAGNVPARISFVTGSNVVNRTERLKVGSTGNFNFNNNQLFLRQSDGNVGIGTTFPNAKLHVVGTSIFADNMGVSGNISAYSNEPGGTGIFGSGESIGVSGFAYGDDRGGTNTTGVYGKTTTHNGTGVAGEVVSPGGIGYGVTGSVDAEVGWGVLGNAPASLIGYGVYGSGSGDFESYGVYGVATGSTSFGVYGNAELYGVYGAATGSGGYGVYGITSDTSSYAGYFDGNIFSSGSYVGSDRTLKTDINNVTSAMDLIKKLQPKSYTFRQDGNYKLMNLPAGKHYGLIAQDVEQVLPNLVKATTFETGKAAFPAKLEPGAKPTKQSVKPSSETIAFKALNYIELIPIVIKGIQELDAENKEKENSIIKLEAEIAGLRQMILDLKNDRTGSTTGTSKSSFLEQNIPNPVVGNTTIQYQVPVTSSSAKLTITNAKGQLIKTIMISNSGAGQVIFNTSILAAGTYNYSLWVQGKQVDTKRLIVAR